MSWQSTAKPRTKPGFLQYEYCCWYCNKSTIYCSALISRFVQTLTFPIPNKTYLYLSLLSIHLSWQATTNTWAATPLPAGTCRTFHSTDASSKQLPEAWGALRWLTQMHTCIPAAAQWKHRLHVRNVCQALTPPPSATSVMHKKALSPIFLAVLAENAAEVFGSQRDAF